MTINDHTTAIFVFEDSQEGHAEYRYSCVHILVDESKYTMAQEAAARPAAFEILYSSTS